ncbi:MAG TPA: hypothetical protein VHV99_22945, partial [Paraburkholderia sp.]|nr:hypothetical protein [Paraburkholderia sp.]
EPLSFAYFSLRQAKKSRCLPRTGATLIDQYQFKERPTPQANRKRAPRRQTTQGKANTTGKQKASAAQANNSGKGQHHRQTESEPHAGKQLKERPTP